MTTTVMLYDGQCHLCAGSMRLVRRLDWLNRVTYLDAQDWAAVEARYPALDRAAVLGLIHVITAEGRVLVGYDGVRHLAQHLPPVAWLATVLFLPGVTWLGRRLYGWVARRRYGLSRVLGKVCSDDTCRVHTD